MPNFDSVLCEVCLLFFALFFGGYFFELKARWGFLLGGGAIWVLNTIWVLDWWLHRRWLGSPVKSGLAIPFAILAFIVVVLAVWYILFEPPPPPKQQSDV
jgi:hypothetical protein